MYSQKNSFALTHCVSYPRSWFLRGSPLKELKVIKQTALFFCKIYNFQDLKSNLMINKYKS